VVRFLKKQHFYWFFLIILLAFSEGRMYTAFILIDE